MQCSVEQQFKNEKKKKGKGEGVDAFFHVIHAETCQVHASSGQLAIVNVPTQSSLFFVPGSDMPCAYGAGCRWRGMERERYIRISLGISKIGTVLCQFGLMELATSKVTDLVLLVAGT